MEIISNRYETIYKNEFDGKVSYAIGLSKKKEDGTYENGYMPVRFKKDVSLDNKTKIKIKQAWIDFYKIEKKTFVYLFINDFEKEQQEKQEQSKDIWNSGKNIEIDDDELPFY